MLRAQHHTRRSHCPQSSPHRSAHATPFSYAGPHTPLPSPAVASKCAHSAFFLVQGSHPFFGRPSSLPPRSALCRARMQARAHPKRIAPRSHARTHVRAQRARTASFSGRPSESFLIKQSPRGLLQKTQTTKLPDLVVVAHTLFWSFCAGQRRIGPGQITDGTYKQTPSAGYEAQMMR